MTPEMHRYCTLHNRYRLCVIVSITFLFWVGLQTNLFFFIGVGLHDHREVKSVRDDDKLQSDAGHIHGHGNKNTRHGQDESSSGRKFSDFAPFGLKKVHGGSEMDDLKHIHDTGDLRHKVGEPEREIGERIQNIVHRESDKHLPVLNYAEGKKKELYEIEKVLNEHEHLKTYMTSPVIKKDVIAHDTAAKSHNKITTQRIGDRHDSKHTKAIPPTIVPKNHGQQKSTAVFHLNSAAKQSKLTNLSTSTTEPLIHTTKKNNNKIILKTVNALSSSGKIRVKDVNDRHFKRNSTSVGEDGSAVMTQEREQHEVSKRWSASFFNEYVSDKISLERSVPDSRKPECRQKTYDYKNLPATTVIICFTEESRSALLRSVHSVLNRTPPELLREILLVDDFSKREHLGKELADYFAKFPKVKIIRLKTRHGLVRARLVATEQAKAPVIAFLDSHVECNVGWLEPLLEVIVGSGGKAVASPTIDVIDPTTFMYQPSPDTMRGGFTWSLEFRWQQIPPSETKRRTGPTDTIRTPTMAGGLFVIDKRFFNTLGTYDPGLEIWGSENMELSFKTWMCGGTLDIVPCSRVGHIFRARQPYKFPSGSNVNTFLRNNMRIANVWMDEYSDIFYSIFPKLRSVNAGDLKERKQMRKSMKCKNFDWYLKNVYPELHVPSSNPRAGHELRQSNTCLTISPDDVNNAGALTACHGFGGHQHVQLTSDDRIESLDECLGVIHDQVTLVNCRSPIVLRVKHRAAGDPLVDRATGRCVTAVAGRVRMAPCVRGKTAQQWTFGHYFYTHRNVTMKYNAITTNHVVLKPVSTK